VTVIDIWGVSWAHLTCPNRQLDVDLTKRSVVSEWDVERRYTSTTTYKLPIKLMRISSAFIINRNRTVFIKRQKADSVALRLRTGSGRLFLADGKPGCRTSWVGDSVPPSCVKYIYTVSKTPTVYISNKLSKNEPILITFGVQNLEEISHQKIINSSTSPE